MAVYARDTTEFDRALNFVDAIFGFSVTLLVTTLEVPPAEAWKSPSALLSTGLGDQLTAFAISFAVVAGFWRTNHRIISTFQALDTATLRMLIYLVAFVIFIPFTTRAISDPDPADLPLPTAVYATNVAIVVLLSVALVIVAKMRGLSDDRDTLASQIAGGLTVAVVFAASIPIAYRFGPDTAKWSWLSLLVLSPAASWIARRSVSGR